MTKTKELKLKIRKLCDERGIENQSRFIHMMYDHGISRNTAIKLYSDDSNVYLSTLVPVAAALDCSVTELLEYS